MGWIRSAFTPLARARTWIVKVPGCYPLIITFSLRHWEKEGTRHGPESNPKVMTARIVRLKSVASPSTGWRLWVYFSGGYAWYGDLYVDRRPKLVRS